jgi:methylmalonyl-CoA/ethylmalonyl-CoA epimerase
MNRKFGPVFHLGYLVPDLDAAIDYWVTQLQVGPFFVETYDLPQGFAFRGRPIHVKSKVALAFSGELYVELIQEFSEDETPNTLFMKSFPGFGGYVAGGLQHVGCMVDSVADILADPVLGRHVAMTGEVGPIRLAYLEPEVSALPGAMMELIERGPYIEVKIATIKAASVGWDGSEPVRTLPRPLL